MGLVVGATPNFLQSWCHKKTNQNLFGTFLPLMYLVYVTYTRMFFGKKKKKVLLFGLLVTIMSNKAYQGKIVNLGIIIQCMTVTIRVL